MRGRRVKWEFRVWIYGGVGISCGGRKIFGVGVWLELGFAESSVSLCTPKFPTSSSAFLFFFYFFVLKKYKMVGGNWIDPAQPNLYFLLDSDLLKKL